MLKKIACVARDLHCKVKDISFGNMYYLYAEGDWVVSDDVYVVQKKGLPIVASSSLLLKKIMKMFPDYKFKIRSAYFMIGSEKAFALTGDFAPGFVSILDGKKEGTLDDKRKLIVKEC